MVVLIFATAAAAGPRTEFVNDEPWPDDHGVHINAHGGGILFHDGAYYWFGQHMVAGTAGNQFHVGVHCYRSSDLYNWSDAGIALAAPKDRASDIAEACILERPKVIFNAKTNKFVMWFHLEAKGHGYAWAHAGVAVSDRPEGPYAYVHQLRPNAGQWPVNVNEADKTPGKNNYLARDFVGGQMVRDMTLFVDDDGSAYLIASSEDNTTLQISRLSDDYLTTSGQYARVLPNGRNEGAALCKFKGKYWMLSSGLSGWNPNSARSAVADAIFGPWKSLGNPTVGVNPLNKLGPEKTFGGQSTFILPVQGRPGAFIAMFDVWQPRDAIKGNYIWLPMRFDGDRFTITWRDRWNLSAFDQ
jgi:hypothetical protein